jgi:hypothetical protein
MQCCPLWGADFALKIVPPVVVFCDPSGFSEGSGDWPDGTVHWVDLRARALASWQGNGSGAVHGSRTCGPTRRIARTLE